MPNAHGGDTDEDEVEDEIDIVPAEAASHGGDSGGGGGGGGEAAAAGGSESEDELDGDLLLGAAR